MINNFIHLKFSFCASVLGCALLGSCVHSEDIRDTTCQVTDLQLVFSSPVSYRGQRFCGEVIGIPRGLGIAFFPLGYQYPDRDYDLALFLRDRRAVDLLRLSQLGPFRIYLEGEIELAEQCFSDEAVRGELECTPVRRPINLRNTRVGEPGPA